MRKTGDVAFLIMICILILFGISLIVLFFNSNNIKDNSNLDNNNIHVYNEHKHETTENNNVINLQKVYEDIGTYTTKIQDKDSNRIYNIKLATKKLDGHIVKSGEEFSFNNTLGTMGKADGFKKAVGFDSNGNKIKMYGGGICQISSTLYNAVLTSDLQVTERHAHSRRVYYVPKNKDATVFYGGPDFKFKNTSDSNIMICASTDGYTVTVTLKQDRIKET